MIILYVSHLSSNITAGPNWSVPEGVKAQSKIDDVLWVNMTDAVMPHWKDVVAYHNVSEYGGKMESLDCLPAPFNNPDVVVFEGFYYMDDVRIANVLRRKKVPYIITPRGSLTKLAMHNHAWLKKWVAHRLFFDGYVKNAKAIQYLTKQEAIDSIGRFHTPYFIVPNGFNTPDVQKSFFSTDGIKAVFIGRLDMFHKGIDLLLESFSHIHAQLLDAHFFFDIYGPRRYDYDKIDNEIASRGITDIVAIHNEVCGEEKERVLLDSDIFLMTSRFEGHPMGLIEALAYGLPCMVTPGTNMFEVIRKSNAGWTCDGNIDDIKKALIKIIKEKDLYAQKGENGRKLSQEYNWDKLAMMFHNCLYNCLH